ncbi:hypothetical protein CEXT_98461 [Caerostris extrusa]|uniref:Uncharacterized protein n=1 Tax=Caerostris extrusa TaxID=172846 RepID=A0AAV4S5M1_CAEEX|nr:hypothetical protein CEXT_98461 [Caerostris extrusa]
MCSEKKKAAPTRRLMVFSHSYRLRPKGSAACGSLARFFLPRRPLPWERVLLCAVRVRVVILHDVQNGEYVSVLTVRMWVSRLYASVKELEPSLVDLVSCVFLSAYLYSRHPR